MTAEVKKNKEFSTIEFIRLIGSPFYERSTERPSDDLLLSIYDRAFDDRVAPLYLHLFRYEGWHPELEEKYQNLLERQKMTQTVLVDLAKNLSQITLDEYVIMKSIKPYPAVPNDTDAVLFGGKKEFDNMLQSLYDLGYVFHEWAPMQTTLCDKRGIGKIGKGKKGGVYYIDLYQDISTDYVCYLDKASIKPFVYSETINGEVVQLLKPEVELAIILFHNLFPERSYQLEHFYMPLYYLAKADFDIELFLKFVKENHMDYAIRSNLTLIDDLHETCFGESPFVIKDLLIKMGRNEREAKRFSELGMQTPYMFSPRSFFATIWYKLADRAFVKSLFIQGLHMLNPVFFLDVVRSIRNRLSEYGTYHQE